MTEWVSPFGRQRFATISFGPAKVSFGIDFSGAIVFAAGAITASANFARHLFPPGNAFFRLFKSMRTPKVPQAASMTRSTTWTELGYCSLMGASGRISARMPCLTWPYRATGTMTSTFKGTNNFNIVQAL